MVKISASIKHSSVLRKFSIIFLIVSIVPLGLLTYIFFELKQHNELADYIPNLQLALTITIIGIGIGYVAIRKIINEFIKVGTSSRDSLTKILGPRGLTNPIDENNEVLSLTRTFNEVTQRLEEDIHELKLTKATLHSVLSKVSHAVATEHDIDHFLQLIIETATEAFFGKAGFILLIDKKTNEIYIKSMAGEGLSVKKEDRFKINESIWAGLVKSKTPVIISKEELGTFPPQHTNFLEAPLLCTPLLIRDEPQGVMIISGRKVPQGYQEEDKNLIYTVALQSAVILNNVELKTLASIDPLTSVYNYRHMIERLDYEIARLKRYTGAMSLLIIDIDDFKKYNDSFGHVEGDILLQSVATTMRNQLRITDIVCRYAGDEFVIILPGTEIVGAKVVAEKLRLSIEKSTFKQKVTVSVGCARWIPNLTRQELIVKADTALYKAKNSNKNSIVLCEGDGA